MTRGTGVDFTLAGLLDAMNWQRLQTLDKTLNERAISREQEQRQFLQTKAALQGRIKELEERVMSYTGLAVTANDLTLLNNAIDTLQTAHKAMIAIRSTEPWRNRAEIECSGLLRLAKRVQAEVSLAVGATNAGSAA